MSTGHLRVVFACVPQAGHLRPLLPLAGALAAAGAEVVVASGPGVEDAVEAAGFECVTVGPGFGEWFGRLAGRTRGQPGAGLAPEAVERYFVPRLFAEVGLDLMVDGLAELLRHRRPDLLVFEPYVLAAPLAGALAGVPVVEHTIGLPLDPLVAELVRDAITPAWVAAGLPAPGPSPAALTLDVCPPTLGGGVPDNRRQPLRPVPLPVAGEPLPVDLPHPGRPLVYFTLGTFSNSALAVFDLVLRALADLPVNVLVTAGDDDTAAALGEAPGNAVVTGFLPQTAILPHCAAVVHHAGAGTTFGALAAGLPALALPQSADNFSIARRLDAVGAARVLMPAAVTEDAVRAAVCDLLADAGTRAAAGRLAAEIAAMSDPYDMLPVLHSLARRAI
jgi:UDP:flavonoid glycosyltransferase YjiC (YdhE family)